MSEDTLQFEGEELAVCVCCGTQYDVKLGKQQATCRICEDPRQFFSREGQQWTSLHDERGKHETKWKQDDEDDRIWHLYVEPKLGIGERASLIVTDQGNVLWDLFAYLDEPLINFINSKGPLKAIVISHPHFYTTHQTWAAVYRNKVPIYISALDKHWLNRPDPQENIRFLSADPTTIIPGVTAIRVGGHFEGSTVLHVSLDVSKPDKAHLFVADAILPTPAGLGGQKAKEHSWFTFMWSIPNMIPLGPEEVQAVWDGVKDLEFGAVHGLMMGMDVRGNEVKKEVLKSAQVQIRRMGWGEHPLLLEKV